MLMTVEATYENGAFKLEQPLPLDEHERVRITVQRQRNWVEETRGLIPCTDDALIDRIALSHEFDCGGLGDEE